MIGDLLRFSRPTLSAIAARRKILTDMVIRVNSLFWRLTTTEGETAIGILKQALERFSNYATAHSMLAFMLLVSGYVGCTVMEPQVKQTSPFAALAAELDDSDPWAHLALGFQAFSILPKR